MSSYDTTSETQSFIKCSTLKHSLLVPPVENNDLSNSFQLSISTPMITEDLIMNEDIEFPSSIEEESDYLSMSYTKTLNSAISSIFPSFYVPKCIVNSAPNSNNESFTGKKIEITAPFAFHTEIKVDHLRVPDRSKYPINGLRIVIKDENQNLVEHIFERNNEITTPVFDKCEGENEIILEEDSKKCGCGMCIIS